MKLGDMIAKFKEIEAFVDKEKEQFEKAMEPWKQSMDVISAAIKKELLDQNLKSFKADAGTAYLSHVLSVKVDDREKFLDFVRGGANWDFLDVRVLKEPVKVWLDNHPTRTTDELGLLSTWNVNLNIRKPT